jgi:hypothetical protein
MVRAITAAFLAFSIFLAPGAYATTTPSNIPNTMRDYAGSNQAEDLVIRADEALNALTYTYYSEKNVWDTASGIYKVICSYYLNNLLDDALPAHYDAMLEMVDKASYGRLSSWDYYDIIRTIPYGSTAYGWKRIEKVADLRPGDVVIWKKTDGDSWGHAYIIASVPKRNYGWSGAYEVTITDSTSSPHSNDSRGSSGTGVGTGQMLLRAGSTGRIYQQAWSLKGYWKDGSWAMARPMPI